MYFMVGLVYSVCLSHSVAVSYEYIHLLYANIFQLLKNWLVCMCLTMSLFYS